MRYWALGALFVVLLLVCGNALMAWRVNSNLASRVASIRTTGAPASIADLKPQPIPAQVNSGAYLDQVAARLEAFDSAFAKLPESVYRDADDDSEVDGEGAGESKRMTEAEKLAAIDGVLANFADLEPLIAQAAACEDYASAANFTLPFDQFLAAKNPRMAALRAAGRLTMLRMKSLVAHGRPDEAIACGIHLLRLSRLYENEPGLVHFLVTIAVRGTATREMGPALAGGRVSTEVLDALEAELARQDDPDKIVRAMQLERALAASAAESTQSQARSGVASRLFGWTVARHYVGPLEYYEDLLPKLARPWHEMHRSVNTMQVKREFGVLVISLAPAVVATYEAANRDIAVIRSLRILNALQRFAAENGRDARGLEELGLPAAATDDPFSGKPLILKLTDDGWVVYSVGRNGQDDGGALGPFLDAGVGPASAAKAE